VNISDPVSLWNSSISLWQLLVLGGVQGAAELLPVSSSAHVIVAEKLMGIDPSSPEATFLLVMLHTGTMFAVIAYFWKSWGRDYFANSQTLIAVVINLVVATVLTGIVGLGLQFGIEHVFMHGQAKAEIEDLFSNLWLIGGALLAAAALIFYSGAQEEKQPGDGDMNLAKSLIIGAVQGLCLPFRGFSRSGATISTGLLLGVERRLIEEFSFALAVVLTPVIVVKELLRLLKAHPEFKKSGELAHLLTPGLAGMVCAFVAGLLALMLLSRLLEAGKWKFFGIYCFVAALAVFGLAFAEPAVPAAEPPPTATVTPVQPPTPATNAASAQPPLPANNEGPLPRVASVTNSAPADTSAAPATNAPASAEAGSRPIDNSGTTLTPGTINQPVFNPHGLSTNSAPMP
jgi:undecaprenyl-diphosphatase